VKIVAEHIEFKPMNKANRDDPSKPDDASEAPERNEERVAVF